MYSRLPKRRTIDRRIQISVQAASFSRVKLFIFLAIFIFAYQRKIIITMLIHEIIIPGKVVSGAFPSDNCQLDVIKTIRDSRMSREAIPLVANRSRSLSEEYFLLFKLHNTMIAEPTSTKLSPPNPAKLIESSEIPQ